MEPADAAVLRQRGDARARAGDHSGAVEAYSLLLQLPPAQVRPESDLTAACAECSSPGA
jgi:Flp pilus assembly protein TadD